VMATMVIGTPLFGLITSHAYTLLGGAQIKDAAGKVTAQLISVRNPWGRDTYTGKWADSSPLWTASAMA